MSKQETPKITKLPPAYPEGSFSKWYLPNREQTYTSEAYVGGTQHCELLDAGRSLLEPEDDSFTYWDAERETRLQLQLTQEAAVAVGTNVRKGVNSPHRTERRSKEGYHQRTRGITAEPSNEVRNDHN